MKRVILFMAIFIALSAITRAQSSEKVKTKIEKDGFKKKTKVEGQSQQLLMSTSAHPAYVHHNSSVHHYTTERRHMTNGTMHVAHKKSVSHSYITHYKKMKKIRKNGEYKIKYKT